MKRTHHRRPERAAALIREVVAQAISQEIRDPRVGFVTITRVDVTRDLSVAEVWFSVMGGDEKKREEALAGLEHARGFLRSKLAQKLSMRSVPELRFRIDRNLEHAAHIDELLKKIHDSDTQTD